jgi:hypothetical protein
MDECLSHVISTPHPDPLPVRGGEGIESVFIREGMRLVDGRPENSGSSCRTDGNWDTIRACWQLTSRRLAGDARGLRLEFNLRFRE